MQLIAGGRRKNTIGARTASARLGGPAIQANDHLHQCVVYIDLNMVRAGSGQHPREWEHSEYREIHKPPSRYGIIDLLELHALFAFADTAQFQETHGQWIEQALTRHLERENRWSEAIAVGSLACREREERAWQ
jgi:putative transposase